MAGAPGRDMDAALHNADLPLMLKDPSQYPGIQRTHIKEQQAQHKKLMDQGVLFYVNGKACTPCDAHLELELKLKSLNSSNASNSASFSLQKAYERMGEKGNLRLVKACSTHQLLQGKKVLISTLTTPLPLFPLHNLQAATLTAMWFKSQCDLLRFHF